MKKDSNQNTYEDVANMRITYKKDKKVISFQAYKNAETDSLHIGPEIEVKNKEVILELIEALCKLAKG